MTVAVTTQPRYFLSMRRRIAVGLSRRDSTDIVCWTYDRAYRQEVLTLGKAGGETLDFRPESLSRRFTIDDVRRKVTYDMVSHLTEMENPKSVEWPIRHFYLWQFLFRSSLVKDLRFLKELRIYEDFPWLCEIPLRDPSVTITELGIITDIVGIFLQTIFMKRYIL